MIPDIKQKLNGYGNNMIWSCVILICKNIYIDINRYILNLQRFDLKLPERIRKWKYK